MSCSNCAKGQRWHQYSDGCRGCDIRWVRAGPDFFRVKRNGLLDKPYTDLLARKGLTNEEVRQ